ncbi:MAG: DNA repair protein RecO [Candidatus Pacebacteria bacterium]|nr:DNA repair protein RecO [Candidatus Paceibacterota bacterium]PIR60693.1 MAG: DNA repair protein RecO [Candidatus Pacebacteria bacterium CG10_big_fil_rev_8_21_14_0_10_44_54]
MAAKSYRVTGIVLKRTNVGELDRVVTLLTKEEGKNRYVAKGVRRLHSSSGSNLEPGSLITAHCIQTKSMPIITQTKLHMQALEDTNSLIQVRRVQQLLEILDHLFVPEELDQQTFTQVTNVYAAVLEKHDNVKELRGKIIDLVRHLGYNITNTPNNSLSQQLSTIFEQPLRSFEYLLVK